MATPKTVATYDLNGSLREFDFAFDYLARSFVRVTLIGATRQVLAEGTGYSFVSATRIQTSEAFGPPQWTQIEIRRVTSATERLVDFQDASILRADDLNLSDLQVLHIAEEAREAATETIGTNNEGNLDARGRRIVNVLDPVDPLDVVNRQWYEADVNGVYQNRVGAEQARDKAKEWATKTGVVEGTLKSSKGYSEDSAASASASQASAQASASSAQASATSASTSQNFAGIATSEAFEAEQYATNANSSANSAYLSMSNAQKWATNPEDSVVAEGKFSAFHWAQKASASASEAALFDPQFYVGQSGPTGVAKLPKSSTGSGTAGDFRYNDVKNRVEYWSPTTNSWSAVGAGGSLFEYQWHNGPRSSIDVGCVPTDGQQLLLLTHPDVCQAIWAGKQHSVTEAVWQADPTKRNCWSRGDGTTWVRVPDLNAAVAGTGKPFYLRGGADALNGTSVGDAIRNITGSTGNLAGGANGGNYGTGALKRSLEIALASTGGAGGGYYGVSFDASLSVPTADENRVKTAYGVWTVRVFTEVSNVGALDAGQLATQLGVVDAAQQALDANTGFTIIYPNGGSAATPANVAVNTRYVMDNPFPGFHVITEAEILVNGVWGATGFIYPPSGGMGVAAHPYTNSTTDKIVVTTGSAALCSIGANTGSPHLLGANITTPTPCRVKVWKLKG